MSIKYFKCQLNPKDYLSLEDDGYCINFELNFNTNDDNQFVSLDIKSIELLYNDLGAFLERNKKESK